MVHCMDEQIGRLLQMLEKRGMLDNTIIIFSSDNGGPLGMGATNGNLRAGKGTLYEGGVRVAAFVTWQGRIKGATVIREPLHVVDWYPTLLQLTGASLQQKLPIDGKNIWPVLTEGKPSPHEDILFNVSPGGGALRKGDWKLVLDGNMTGEDSPDFQPECKKGKGKGAKKGNNILVELFNLREDPTERTNLAEQQPDRVRELRARLQAYAQQAVPPRSAPKRKDFVSPKIWGEGD